MKSFGDEIKINLTPEYTRQLTKLHDEVTDTIVDFIYPRFEESFHKGGLSGVKELFNQSLLTLDGKEAKQLKSNVENFEE